MNPITALPVAAQAVELFPSQALEPSEKDLRVLRFFDLNPAPPHAFMESGEGYSIYFNMQGIDQKNIGIDVNATRREVTVLARREKITSQCGFYWIFGVPYDGSIADMTARFEGGVLAIIIPKRSAMVMSA